MPEARRERSDRMPKREAEPPPLSQRNGCLAGDKPRGRWLGRRSAPRRPIDRIRLSPHNEHCVGRSVRQSGGTSGGHRARRWRDGYERFLLVAVIPHRTIRPHRLLDLRQEYLRGRSTEQATTGADGGLPDARPDSQRVESPDSVAQRRCPGPDAIPAQSSPVGSRIGRVILKVDSARPQSINIASKANALLIPTVLMALETGEGRGEMEWVGLIIQWVAIALECVVYATLGGGAGSANSMRSDRSNRSDRVPPLDAEALAWYVSRSSTRDVRGGGSFRTSRESADPLWDRELDG
jgi:hypothetical protein